jgi:superfamily II DNA/RNA helicase
LDYIDHVAQAITCFQPFQSYSTAKREEVVFESFIEIKKISVGKRADIINKTIIPSTVVFVNTVHSASSIFEALKKLGINCAEFHKNVPADQRVQVIDQFKRGQIPVLIATDHASRYKILCVIHTYSMIAL